MPDDEKWLPLSEQYYPSESRQARRRAALLLAFRVYAVLGALFAALAILYFLFLKYGIELTSEEKQAIIAAIAGIAVSGLSMLAAGTIRRSMKTDTTERFPRHSDGVFARNALVVAKSEDLQAENDEPHYVSQEISALLRQLPMQAGSHLYASIFVERWSVFETACRKLTASDKQPISQLLKILAARGILSDEEVLLARECLMVRNDIVHGQGRMRRTLDELSALVDILNDLIRVVQTKTKAAQENSKIQPN